MNTILWIAQALLAITLAWSSSMKLGLPADKLAEMWPWTAEHRTLVKITGILDLLAAIGLVFPSLLRIEPKLTVYAAIGLIALMVAAMIFHISRGEGSDIGVNIFIAGVAAFIAWGRLIKAPVLPK